MKKTILAAAIPALLIASTASVSAANIYSADGTTINMFGKITVDMVDTDISDPEMSEGAEFFTAFDHVINDDYTALGLVKFNANTAENCVTAYCSVDAIDDTDLFATMEVTDILAGFKGPFGEVVFGKLKMLIDDYLLADEAKNVIEPPHKNGLGAPDHDAGVKYSYRSPKYSIQLAYGFDEGKTRNEQLEAALQVNFNDDFIMTAAYAEWEVNDDGAYESDSTYYQIGAEYTMGDIDLAAAINNSDSAMGETDGISACVRYNGLGDTGLYAGMLQTDNGDTTDYYYAGVDRQLGNSTSVYFEAGDVAETQTVAIGMEVQWQGFDHLSD